MDILMQEQEKLRAVPLISQLGSSASNPAEECGQIKNKYRLKRKGLYWVRGECMSSVLRVYCDFSTQHKAFYHYTGPVLLTQHLLQSFSSSATALLWIREQCLPLGLSPVEVGADSQVTNLIAYLGSLGVQFDDQMIPLAVDYPCVYQGQCSKRLFSLNDLNSPEVSSLYECRDPTQLHSQQTDGLAFGLSLHLLARVPLGTTLFKGVLCSDNNSGPLPLYSLTCTSSIFSDDHFNSPFFTHFKLRCPPRCAGNPAPIYGDFLFKEDSSICKAAVFLGLLQDQKGGPVVL